MYVLPRRNKSWIAFCSECIENSLLSEPQPSILSEVAIAHSPSKTTPVMARFFLTIVHTTRRTAAKGNYFLKRPYGYLSRHATVNKYQLNHRAE